MFLQKSMKFCSIIIFEENGLNLNCWFSSIFFEKTPKFEAYMNTYSWNNRPNFEQNGQNIDFLGISKYQTT